MATIEDVARVAGVSEATVSRYLNKRPVSAPSRNKVAAAIDQLGYRPSVIARALNNKKVDLVGLIVPTIGNFFYSELYQAINEAASERGFMVMLCDANTVEKERLYIDGLASAHASGIITTTGRCNDLYRTLSRTPVVCVDESLVGVGPFVGSDNVHGGRIAAQHLHDCGCEDVCFMGLTEKSGSQNDRWEGFRQECRSLGMTCREVYVEDDVAPLGPKVRRELASCDGIFAWSDFLALRTYGFLHSIGREVPRDVQLIGFDSTRMGSYFIPKITSIAQDISQVGRCAVEILMDAGRGGELSAARRELIDVCLVQGGTTHPKTATG